MYRIMYILNYFTKKNNEGSSILPYWALDIDYLSLFRSTAKHININRNLCQPDKFYLAYVYLFHLETYLSSGTTCRHVILITLWQLTNIRHAQKRIEGKT